MAYDENLAERIAHYLTEQGVEFEAKKMMGGLTFMVRNKMCVGIVKNELMARIGKGAYEAALAKNGVRQMDFTGRPMRGYVFISPEALEEVDQLEGWIQQCLAFNLTL